MNARITSYIRHIRSIFAAHDYLHLSVPTITYNVHRGRHTLAITTAAKRTCYSVIKIFLCSRPVSTAQIRVHRVVLRHPDHPMRRLTLLLRARRGADCPARATVAVGFAAVRETFWYPRPAIICTPPRTRWSGAQLASVRAHASSWMLSLTAASAHKPLQWLNPKRLRRVRGRAGGGPKVVHSDLAKRCIHHCTNPVFCRLLGESPALVAIAVLIHPGVRNHADHEYVEWHRGDCSAQRVHVR